MSINSLISGKENYLHNILQIIEKLPPMPESIIKLKRTCSDPNANYKNIVSVMETDSALCADILHIANSAYFAVGHQVESIAEAVRYIGFNNVADYVAVSFSQKIVNDFFKNIKDLPEYFKHSNDIALALKCLAIVAEKKQDIQEFYTVLGLLHDIGRLVIYIASDKATLKLLDNEWHHSHNLADDETKLLGINHCLVGMRICEKWNFSMPLQTAILKHHTPLSHGFYEDACFVLLAHFLAMPEMSIQQIMLILPLNIYTAMNLDQQKIEKARELFISRNFPK